MICQMRHRSLIEDYLERDNRYTSARKMGDRHYPDLIEEMRAFHHESRWWLWLAFAALVALGYFVIGY